MRHDGTQTRILLWRSHQGCLVSKSVYTTHTKMENRGLWFSGSLLHKRGFQKYISNFQ
jgi:hypothetical protein